MSTLLLTEVPDCHFQLWSCGSRFVDGILCLDVEGSEENSQDLSDFVKWKWEGKTSNDIVGHQFHEEVLLFDCAFVIAKEEGLIDILYSVIFVKGLKGSL